MEQKNRILIVEDDTDINNLLYTALQKAGYHLTLLHLSVSTEIRVTDFPNHSK